MRKSSSIIEALELRVLFAGHQTGDATAAHLVLHQAPSNGTVGMPLSPSPTIYVEDQSGNLVTTTRSKVTLSIANGPGGASLGGTSVVNVAKGIATFKKTTLNEAGNYVLQASDATLPITTPVQFPVTIAAAPVTISTPKVAASIATGKTANVSASLKSSAGKGVVFTGTASLVDQNGNVLATATPSANGSVKFSFTNSTAGNYTLSVQYSGDPSHTTATSPGKSINVVTKTGGGGGGVGSSKNLTYIGQFNATYSVETDPTYQQPPVTGNVSFNVTIVLHPIATVNGQTAYQIVSAQSSSPFFGAQFAVTPSFGSSAILPNPPLNISNSDGEGFVILFPNGSSLDTDNSAGDMHQSSDGRTISNSLSDTQSWVAGSNSSGQFLEDSIIPAKNFIGTDVGDFTSETWAFTLSAT